MSISRQQKLIIALRSVLVGRKYYRAIRALNLAIKYHDGLRKDGHTRSFMHQIEICLYLTTLEEGLAYPEDTYVVALLHDLPEDIGFSFEELATIFTERSIKALRLITKEYRGVRIPDAQYYAGLATDMIAAIVKGADRLHNLSTMVAFIDPETGKLDLNKLVFSWEKQKSYIAETEEHTDPMLKQALTDFPEQQNVFYNVRHAIRLMIRTIQGIHDALNMPQPAQA